MLVDPLDLHLIDGAVQPKVVLAVKETLVDGIPDGLTAIIAPVVVYWTYSMYFHIMDVNDLFLKYKIHPNEEQLKMNKVPFHVVLRDVFVQHIIQTISGYLIFLYEPTAVTGYENAYLWQWRQLLPSVVPTWAVYSAYWYGASAFKLLIGFLIIDTWQFWLHKLMHQNKFLYKHFHSRHHALYVPYAFGALFNNPVEGFLLDTLGTGLASLVLGMSPKEATFFYTISTMKTIDDHCGYMLPWHFFHHIFPNNTIYHDIHHQRWGIKYNFSQPYFTFWDTWLGNTYHGFDSYKADSKNITLEEYKKFLNERKEKVVKKDN